jgi:hypothetical protein
MSTKANLKIDQGSDYSTSVTITNSSGAVVDLTDYTGEGQIRKYYTSTNAVSLGISLGGNTGVITLTLSANASNNMDFGRYVYDVELTANSGNGLTSRVLEGIVTITPGVTR